MRHSIWISGSGMLGCWPCRHFRVGSGSPAIVIGVAILFLVPKLAFTASLTDLGNLGGNPKSSTGKAFCSAGSVVVGQSKSAAGKEAFRWDNSSGMVGLGDLAGGPFTSDAKAISGDCLVIVGKSTSTAGKQAFRWDATSGMAGLGDLPGGAFNSDAKGISSDGSVIVGKSTSTAGKQAFRWDATSGMVGLGDLPGGPFNSDAKAVSADGSVIVGKSSSGAGKEAFRWDAISGMVGLGDLPGGPFDSDALAVSPNGSVIVGTGKPVGPKEATIWDITNGMRSLKTVLTGLGLNLTGWTLTKATAVSADGLTIAGDGINPAGIKTAWVAFLGGGGPLPAGEWRMDAANWSGTVAEVVDATGNGHDGTATGATTSGTDPAIAGDPGSCRYGSFNGTVDYVQIPHSAALIGSAALTYMAWIRPQSWSGTRQVMAKSVHGGGLGRAQMGIFAEAGVLKARAETNGGRKDIAATLPALNTWSHVAAVFDGTSITLYVNGNNVGTKSFASTTLIANADPLNIGKRVGTAQYFFAGFIDEVRVYNNALSTVQVQAIMAETHPCTANGIDHFAISHDGSAINCQAEPVTIAAHDSSHTVVAGYAGVASLSTTTLHGDWSLLTGSGTLINSGNGTGSYAFAASDAGSVVLGLKNTFTESTNMNLTDGAAIEHASEDANLLYGSAGFNFLANSSKNTIATQIGGKASNVAPGAQTLELEAVRTSDDTGACEAALTGVNTVDLAFECENPGACAARQVAINGTNIAGNSNGAVASFTGINLDFGDNTDTTATFTLSYPDTGQLQLHARRALSPSGETMLGASNSFVVRPFALYVTAAGNPGASSSAGFVFTSAGTNFTSTVKAVLWDAADDLDGNGIADNHNDTAPNNNANLSNNVVAPNFGRESIVESVSLTALLNQPSGGNDPGLAGGTTLATFIAGSGTSSTVRYDEVGIIEMAATIADGNYLGIGAPATGAIAGRSGYVGRFNPARYAVTASNIVPACAAVFTYARQAFDGSLTIVAQNGAAGGNQKTANYRGGFVTLDPASELAFENDQTSGPYDAETIAFVQDFNTGSTGEATLALQFRWDMAEQGPVTSTAQITSVSDEVTVLAGAPVSLGSSTIRYGRIALGGALGSELVNLAVPMLAEYYVDANIGYVTNIDDSCSNPLSFGFSNFAANLASGETCVLDTGSPGLSGAGCVVAGPLSQRYIKPPVLGNFNLFLQASGVGNDGSVTVNVGVPDWLKFDWDASTLGRENPSARATFGIYRGADRQIYRRELY